MKFYINQKKFNIKQGFNILNEQEEVIYTVKGIFNILGRRKLRLMDASGKNELAYLLQKIFALTTHLDVLKAGKKVLSVRKKLLSIKPAYEVTGQPWKVTGSFLQHQYQIVDFNQDIIAEISKKRFALADTFEVDIKDESVNPVDVISVVLIIDTAMDQKK